MNNIEYYNESHKAICESLSDKLYTQWIPSTEERIKKIAEYYGFDELVGKYTKTFGCDICSHTVSRTINLYKSIQETSYVSGARVEIIDNTPTEETTNSTIERWTYWVTHKIEESINDWSMYPTELNDVEQRICDFLKENHDKISNNLRVKVNTDDSLRIIRLEKTRFRGYEHAARTIYEAIPMIHRNTLTGVEFHVYNGKVTSDIYPVFTDKKFYDCMNAYIDAKAAWCDKYGCD